MDPHDHLVFSILPPHNSNKKLQNVAPNKRTNMMSLRRDPTLNMGLGFRVSGEMFSKSSLQNPYES